MTDTTKRYRLLKDIDSPELKAKAGDIGKLGAANKVWFDNGRYFFCKDTVESTSRKEWFEVLSEPVKEKIIIVDMGFSHNNQFGNWYSFSTKSELHPDKYLSIKQAIESALNDTVVEDAKHLPKDIDVELFKLARDNEALKSLLEQMTNYAENWKGLHVKLYNDYADLVAKSIGKTFTQSEVDAIRADTWYAARKITDKVVGEIDFKDGDRCPFYEKYFNSINDYLSSLNLNSNDTGKEDNETKSANWRSENLSKQSAPEPSALPNKEYEIVTCFDNKISEWKETDWHYYIPKGDKLHISNCEDDKCKIRSVRRLPDNTLWSVKQNTNKGIIESFLIITEENSSNSITAHLHRKENIGKIAVKVIGDLGATFPNQLLEDLELPTPTQPVVDSKERELEVYFGVTDTIQYTFDNPKGKLKVEPVVEDKPPLFNDSIFEIPFNMALDMCIGLINQHISMLAAVGKCNEDFDQTRKNIVDSISKLKK